MKLKGSTKIALAFIALIVVLYFGYDIVSGRMIDSKKFGPIGPGRVTLVGIRPGAGFQIKVSNDIAQLVEANDKFEAGSMNETGGDSSDKRQIPLREMLDSLKGNEVALGKVVTQMNDDLRKADLPTVTIRWEASDIRNLSETIADISCRSARSSTP